MTLKKIIFATGNAHKVGEVQQILGDQYQVLSLKDMHCDLKAEEPYDTLQDNAQAKADFYFELFERPVFAEDSGLFVAALGGAPGVKSARYAGEPKSDQANNDLLVKNLQGKQDRSAYFASVIAYRPNYDEIYFFEGRMTGRISSDPYGKGGFGYDPLFIAEEYNVTNAELTSEQKNAISHRGKAMRRFKDFLESEKVIQSSFRSTF